MARVTIKTDDKELVSVRGSTLPDAYLFYGGWFEKGGVDSPVDSDLVQIENRLNDRVGMLRNHPDFRQFSDIADILRVLHEVPILWSGQYSFRMGLHKADKCYDDPLTGLAPRSGVIQGRYLCHGVPRVPRLHGSGNPSLPYDGRTMNGEKLDGGYIATINANQTQNHQRIARGINVHDGRRGGEIRDSEGCLTIHPDSWRTFYEALPAPSQWQLGRDSGVVVIERRSVQFVPPSPAAPSSVSVQ